jgi:DNA primase
MSKTAFVDFKAVKSAITMEQVLTHYGVMDKFKRGTDSLNGPCPIHKGSNPTQFRVSISKNIWNCFSECKHGGNVLDFIAEMEKCSIHAAALKAIEWFNLDPEAMVANSGKGESGETKSPAPAPNAATQPASLPKPAPAPAPESSTPNTPLKFRLDKLERNHPYLLEQRGLTPETIADFGIGFCSKGMMADRIAIPIHNVKGEVVAYAGRFIGAPPEGAPKYKLPPGFRKSQELFNIDVIQCSGRLCRVIRVNECAAVVIMNRPVRDFKTRFDKPVRFQPPPALFRISPHSVVPILNRKLARSHKAIH